MSWRKATHITYVACLLALVGSARLSAAEIAISRLSDLSFGQIISSTLGGTVSISTNGIRSASGTPVVASSSGSQASFTVTGDNNTSYAIIMPSSILLSGTGQDMTVDSFVSNPADSGVLNGTGSQVLCIGATLHVEPHQQAGSYIGTVDVSVAYE